MDRDEEKIERLLHQLLSGQRQRTGRRGCPEEELLASYLSGNLPEDARQEMESHLAECPICLEDIVSAHKAEQDNETKTIPQQVIDRAIAFVSPVQGKQDFLDLVVRLAKESLELVSTSGHLILTPAPVRVRGKPRPSGTGIVQVEKEIGRFNVAVEVEHMEAGLCRVVVRVQGKRGEPAEGIRLSLFSMGREQASCLTRKGQVVFDRIPLGEYNLAISDSGTPLGTVALKLIE